MHAFLAQLWHPAQSSRQSTTPYLPTRGRLGGIGCVLIWYFSGISSFLHLQSGYGKKLRHDRFFTAGENMYSSHTVHIFDLLDCLGTDGNAFLFLCLLASGSFQSLY